jgi:hypothetical protein
MNSFDKFLELVKDKSRAPSWNSPGYVFWGDSKVYGADKLVTWLCQCAEDANCDIRRIDEDQQKHEALAFAISVAIGVMSGGSIQTDIGEYLVSQLITDAAGKYMQDHPSILEWAGHLSRKLFS